MVNVLITIDGVLRDKITAFNKQYTKNIDPDFNLNESDSSSSKLDEIFPFNTENDFRKFLFDDYGFEIFAEAPLCVKSVDKKLYLWNLMINTDSRYSGKINLMMGNPNEFAQSIGFTCFFLAKTSSNIREYYFPKESSLLWDKADVIITADENLLNIKPDGKMSIKINSKYNKNCKSDYEFDDLEDFLNNTEIIEKIISFSK